MLYFFYNKNVVSATVIPRRENLNVINVTQFEKDAILVCYDSEHYMLMNIKDILSHMVVCY